MTVYIVTYDLRAPGRSYTALYDRLTTYTHCKALESVWLIDTPQTAAQVRDNLRQVMDANDRLLVAMLSGASAWTTMLPGAAQFLQSRFGAA
mgnify:CR=1 FL=1